MKDVCLDLLESVKHLREVRRAAEPGKLLPGLMQHQQNFVHVGGPLACPHFVSKIIGEKKLVPFHSIHEAVQLLLKLGLALGLGPDAHEARMCQDVPLEKVLHRQASGCRPPGLLEDRDPVPVMHSGAAGVPKRRTVFPPQQGILLHGADGSMFQGSIVFVTSLLVPHLQLVPRHAGQEKFHALVDFTVLDKVSPQHVRLLEAEVEGVPLVPRLPESNVPRDDDLDPVQSPFHLFEPLAAQDCLVRGQLRRQFRLLVNDAGVLL